MMDLISLYLFVILTFRKDGKITDKDFYDSVNALRDLVEGES